MSFFCLEPEMDPDSGIQFGPESSAILNGFDSEWGI